MKSRLILLALALGAGLVLLAALLLGAWNGMVRAREPIPRQFLERCLGEFTDVWLTAKAVQSLGWMYERGYKDLFERIALGDFGDGIALSEKASEWDTKYLQRKAIEALANIGDRDTLARLRAERTDWGPELERIFYWTSEEIYWRLGPGGGQ